MTIGVPKETFPGEQRVAIVPRAMELLAKGQVDFVVESGAGAAAGFPDREYVEKGARIAKDHAEVFAASELVLQVRLLGANPQAGRADLDLLQARHALAGFCEPLPAVRECAELAARGVTSFSMELM